MSNYSCKADTLPGATDTCHQTYITYSCNTQSVPGYWGRWSWYFLSRPGGTKRPPRKWYRPLNKEADFLGAVREMSMSGCNPSALPFSTSQPVNQTKRTGYYNTVQASSSSSSCEWICTVEIVTIRSWWQKVLSNVRATVKVKGPPKLIGFFFWGHEQPISCKFSDFQNILYWSHRWKWSQTDMEHI